MLIGNQLVQRARAYLSLAAAIEAGLPLDRALPLIGAGAVEKQRLARAVSRIDAGGTLSEALEETGIVPAIEARVIEAAELAGKLPDLLRRLASDLEERTSARRRLAAKLIYPIVLFHAAVLLPAARHVVSDGVLGYLAVVAPVLGGAYALVGVAWLVARSLRARAADGRSPLIASLPLVGGLARELATADFANLLALLLSAGIPLPAAIDRAAASCGDSRIAHAGRRMRDGIDRGGSRFGAAIAAEGDLFPAQLIQAAHVGEASGKLDETLDHVALQLQHDARAHVSAALTAVAALVYVAAVLVVGYSVITTFMTLYSF